jgi:uncharacterized membrane protein YcfT
MGYAGAFAVMIIATVFSHHPSMNWLRYLGRHSIVVYLGFVIPIGFMRRFIVNQHLINDMGSLSLIVMCLSVAGAILLYWLVRNTPLRFLFERPAWASISPVRVAHVKEGASA